MAERTIEIGMDVIGADGDKLGTLGGVVIDPRTGEITAGVLHRGHVFTDDVMVPREAITSIDAASVRVNFTRTEAHAMVDRHATDLLNPPAGFYASSGVYWAPSNVYLADVGIEHGRAPQRQEPPGALLSHGTLVVDNDGQELGRIVEIAADERGHVAGFRVEAGRFRHHQRYIPAHFIAAATNERVTLAADAAQLEAMHAAAPAQAPVREQER